MLNRKILPAVALGALTLAGCSTERHSAASAPPQSPGAPAPDATYALLLAPTPAVPGLVFTWDPDQGGQATEAASVALLQMGEHERRRPEPAQKPFGRLNTRKAPPSPLKPYFFAVKWVAVVPLLSRPSQISASFMYRASAIPKGSWVS